MGLLSDPALMLLVIDAAVVWSAVLLLLVATPWSGRARDVMERLVEEATPDDRLPPVGEPAAGVPWAVCYGWVAVAALTRWLYL